MTAGGKEANEVIRTWGSNPDFAFDAKEHIVLATGLGLIDYERGVKLRGNGYWLYREPGARLEWGLLNYFIESHLASGLATSRLVPAILEQLQNEDGSVTVPEVSQRWVGKARLTAT